MNVHNNRLKSKFIFFYIIEPQINSGAKKKIITQCKILSELGYDVELCAVGNPNDLGFSNEFIRFVNIDFRKKIILLKRIFRGRKIANILNKYYLDLEYGDFFYFRYPCPIEYLPFRFFLRKKCFLIFEHNTIEPNEFRLNGIFSIGHIIEILLGKPMRVQSDGIVSVTDEITRYELKRSGKLNKPHITIGNGLDVNSVPIRIAKPYVDTELELHILCVANVSKWHGLDRLLKGMATYCSNTCIIFHIAGEGAEIPLLKQLVEKLNLQDSVIFHGFKTGDELDTLFNSCHIAVGSLGIHRIGLNEASILKAREYCARGIPYIIACADPDFPNDFPYIYRVPPDESPVDIEKIIEFAQTVCTDPDHPKKMRAYALEHLDWSAKMKKLKAFLETLVDE